MNSGKNKATKTKRPTDQRSSSRKSSGAEAPGRAFSGAAASTPEHRETNRRAAAVLEVLAGLRTPAEAAEALGLSVNYYYILERKALSGLHSACRPQPKGPPGPNPLQQVEKLEKQLARCQQECQRQASLVRAAERAIGLSATPAASRGKGSATAGAGKSRRRRRPTVRALKAARRLQDNSSWEDAPHGLKPPADDGQSSSCVATDKETGHGAQGPQTVGDQARGTPGRIDVGQTTIDADSANVAR